MLKTIIIIVCSIVSLAAYIPYIKKTVRGTIKPHFYTWFTCSVVGTIANLLMILGGGGLGVIPTSIGCVSSIIVAIVSFKNRDRLNLHDMVFIGLALLAIPAWLMISDRDLSALAVSSIMLLAFIPTMIKAKKKPKEESASQYLLSSLRFAVSTLGLSKFAIATVAFPAVMSLINIMIVIFISLGHRRLAE
ncbi:TPA: hypothetical protein ACRZZI_004982 [Vibrio harveyi]